MDLQERSELLRLRFERLSGQGAPIIGPSKARGLVYSGKQPRPEPRKGVTKPTSGKWSHWHVEERLWPSKDLPRMAWMEPPCDPNKGRHFKLSRRSGVSPLIRIAERFPKKAERRVSV